jgi:DNA-directed RNA polymerase specialized sigma24 family protein
MSNVDLDTLWQAACHRDQRSFGDWMGRVERPIRLSLYHWARLVDVEGIVQEACLRMWVRAGDTGVPPLTGTNASLRFAIVLAKNLARNEARKRVREEVLPPEDMPDVVVEPDPDPEPRLRSAIRECVEALTGKLSQVMSLRLGNDGSLSDRELAEQIPMKVNTFVQNVVRARKQIDTCLDGKGFPAKERAV